MGIFLSGEDDGKDCKDRGSQESNGHVEKHRLSQMQQAYPHREAGERPRARHPRRNLYLVLSLRIFRKTVKPVVGCQFPVSIPSTTKHRTRGAFALDKMREASKSNTKELGFESP